MPAGADKGEADVDMIRKKALIDAVAEKSGLKRGVARQGLEATLAVLAEALAAGKSVAAPPLGKLKVTREKETGGGKTIVCRVRLHDPNKQPKPKDNADDAVDGGDDD